jgi:hypothetical protein
MFCIENVIFVSIGIYVIKYIQLILIIGLCILLRVYQSIYIYIYIYIYRNLRTQQMSVLVLLFTSYTTCFGPYWWPSSGGL